MELFIAREVMGEWNASNALEQKRMLLPLSCEAARQHSPCDMLVAFFCNTPGESGAQVEQSEEEIEEQLRQGRPALIYFSEARIDLKGSHLLQDGVNGVLFAPGKRSGPNSGEAEADAAFGRAVLELLRDPQARARLGKAAAKIARERAHPSIVQQKLADAFQHAHDHAAASGLRPTISRPKLLQWYTTFQHFRPWVTVMGGVYLLGHLRQASPVALEKIHPQMGW